MIEIKASRGAPYQLSRDDRGVVRVKRQTAGGHAVTLVFSREDVINVCNGLIDLVEGAR